MAIIQQRRADIQRLPADTDRKLTGAPVLSLASLFELVGGACLITGAWQIAHALGLIVAGLMAFGASYALEFVAHQASTRDVHEADEGLGFEPDLGMSIGEHR